MTPELHPTTITPREKEIGFILGQDANPRRRYLGEPQVVPAVVRPVGPCDRVIKLCDPSGKLHYHAQRYGTWASGMSEEKQWLPAGQTEELDPEKAIKLVEAQVGKEVTPKIVIPRKGGKNAN